MWRKEREEDRRTGTGSALLQSGVTEELSVHRLSSRNTEMSFLHWVAGLSLEEGRGVRTQEGLKVEALLLFMERNQLSWFPSGLSEPQTPPGGAGVAGQVSDLHPLSDLL